MQRKDAEISRLLLLYLYYKYCFALYCTVSTILYRYVKTNSVSSSLLSFMPFLPSTQKKCVRFFSSSFFFRCLRPQYESSLLKVVSSDVSGNFGKMMTYALMETDAFGAEVFTTATKGEAQCIYIICVELYVCTYIQYNIT